MCSVHASSAEDMLFGQPAELAAMLALATKLVHWEPLSVASKVNVGQQVLNFWQPVLKQLQGASGCDPGRVSWHILAV